MYSSNTHRHDTEDGIPQEGDGPQIVPLMIDQLRPRRGVTFDILAADFSADCKTRYDVWRGKRKATPTKQRSENYRRARQEFLCFMCCYGMAGVVSFLYAIAFLLSPFLTDRKMEKSEYFNDYDNNPNNFSTENDDDYDPYQDAEGFWEKVKVFLYDGGGFD